jgi:adenylate cyclase class IV
MKIRNVEIKLRIDDAVAARQAIARVADGPARLLEQIDTYFESGPDALLKLRREACDGGDWNASLIAYRRVLGHDPRPSDIRLARVGDGDALHDALSHVLPVAAVVRKKRELSFSGATRIHLDEVVGLGAFVELEVVLTENQAEDDGKRVAESLRERLQLSGAEPSDASYRDLVGAEARPGVP